ncbi:MAG: hypothetical protein KQH53_14995 [Desulfarculaceae bacterium]|nr:hypothetical protein [Desulfarculaceae bacterium]
MDLDIYTSPGCLRCKVAKSYLAEQGMGVVELDIKGEGRDAFTQFYRQHRPEIHRGAEGLEFPILWTGERVVQGVGEIMAWARSGNGLQGFVKRTGLLHGWIDGLEVSGGSPEMAGDFLDVLRHLSAGGIKIQLSTNGANPAILEACQKEGLASKVVMNLLGPPELYAAAEIPPEEVEKTLALLPGFSDFMLRTVVGPVVRADGAISLLTPEEVAAAAAWVSQVTGQKTHAYFLAGFDPAAAEDERLKDQEAMPPTALFKYRTAARPHLVKAEIEK